MKPIRQRVVDILIINVDWPMVWELKVVFMDNNNLKY